MNNSIIGERWHNATSSDLAGINASIADTTAHLNEATRLYNQASAALTTCYGLSQSACLQKTGGYAHSTWSPQYGNNKAKIVTLKAELADLLKLQESIAKTQSVNAETTEKTAVATQAAAAATDAIAKADVATTGATASKVLLYVGLGLGAIVVVVGGIYMFRKMKRK